MSEARPAHEKTRTPDSHLGIVIIGRNEGERLRRCLTSLAERAPLQVYVDSGSSDGSVALAEKMGVHVVALDLALPFTAARARNAGVAKLLELEPNLELVQFVDGDCEVVEGWLESAAAKIVEDPALAVVCGRLRERRPEASVYNRLCDIEWNTPVGYADWSGGNAMMRLRTFSEVGGFNPELIAGEEPDLCLRLRVRGYRILRMADEMMLHDANMTKFGQWWRRIVRSGHAYAEGYSRHRRDPGQYFAKQVRSNLTWGVVLPLLALVLAWPSRGWSLAILAAYPVLGLRVWRSSRRRSFSAAEARLYALACVVGKFPSAYGQLRYWTKKLVGSRSTLIEYKHPPSPKA